MKIPKYLKNQKGVFAIVAVIAMLVLGLFVTALTLLFRREAEMTAGLEKDFRAWAELEAGCERSISDLADDSDWSNNASSVFTNESLESGKYTVTASSQLKDSINLKSVGFMGDAKTTRNCNVTGVSAGAPACIPKTDWNPLISCHPRTTFVAHNQTELDTYLVDGGVSMSPSGSYKRLNIQFVIVKTGDIEIHTPCRISFSTNNGATATGAICIDNAREDQEHNGGVDMSAGTTITMIAQGEDFWGIFRSIKAKDIVIKAETGSMEFAGTEDVSNNITVTAKGTADITLYSGQTLGTITVNTTGSAGNTYIDSGAIIKAGAMSLTSAYLLTFVRGASVTVTGNLHGDAPNCSISTRATIVAGSKSGSCFP